MRFQIDLDEGSMGEAMRLGGSRAKKATVESALCLLIQTRSQAGMWRHGGKVKREGALGISRSRRVWSLLIVCVFGCSLHSRAQTAGNYSPAAPTLAPVTLKMDWSQGSIGSHYGPNFIQLREPCREEGTSCECVISFKVISSKENAREFADYISSFEHGTVPVTFEVAFGQDGLVHTARLASVGEWNADKFQTNDTLLGVHMKFTSGSAKKQERFLHAPADCFTPKKP